MLRAINAAGRRPLCTPLMRFRGLSTSNESVSLPEVESLLMNGIRSIGYNNADATVMKDAMLWARA